MMTMRLTTMRCAGCDKAEQGYHHYGDCGLVRYGCTKEEVEADRNERLARSAIQVSKESEAKWRFELYGVKVYLWGLLIVGVIYIITMIGSLNHLRGRIEALEAQTLEESE